LGVGDKGNSIQLVGGGLENFVVALFSGTLGQSLGRAEEQSKISAAFSYLGTSNQPPDAILKGGDAIEVKKVDSLKSSIQLNSSPPKSKLLASDTRINKTCRELAETEGWKEKDIIYAIGSQENSLVKRLWFVYGDCYAASHEVYENVSERISGAIKDSLPDIDLSDTNEIAGVPNVDPLKITHLRVRGMWIIKNPSVVFSNFVESSDASFKAYCIMREDKFLNISEKSRKTFEENVDNHLSLTTIDIPDPDNPAVTLKARLIKYEK
jgi:hypothetical protein